MELKGCASALGAGTIINAIATWKGGAFGIDLKTRAEVTLNKGGDIRGEIEGGGDTRLIEACVRLVLEEFDLKYGGKVRTISEIPMASGLKSSSAAANATILATLSAIGESLEPLEAVRLGVRAALGAGVTVTGAFDDACASYLGGIVITDNKEMKLLKREERESEVVILAPEEKVFSANTNVKRSRLLAPWIDLAYDLALKGEYEKAMTLNGFLYCSALGFSIEPLMCALEIGTLGVSLSGTGPAYAALLDGEKANELATAWSTLGGRVIRTKINNRGATIERCP